MYWTYPRRQHQPTLVPVRYIHPKRPNNKLQAVLEMTHFHMHGMQRKGDSDERPVPSTLEFPSTESNSTI